MRKKIREIICALITNKEARSKVRHFLGAIRPVSDLKNLVAFYHTPIERNTVLVIEPNECHGECLCSYLKYFNEAGYKTHLITTPTSFKLQPLHALPEKYLPQKVFTLSPQQYKRFFKLVKLKKYSHIFLCSTQNYYYGKSNIDALKIPKSIQSKMMLMEHDLRQIELYKEEEFLKNGRLFVITNFAQNPQLKSLSAHYFPAARATSKNENKTNFITVGALDIKRRNITLLFDAVNNLLENNIKNFKITVIGGGKVKNLPEEIKEYFDIKSRLNFPEMTEELNNADFILPLLDPTNKNNRAYLQYLTTGTKHLILGFKKPCIINEEFAAALGFDEKDSLIYRENEIYNQMKTAIFLDKANYQNMQNSLTKKAENLYSKSLHNLKEALKND